ncbi:RHS repeat-associated core domain-containing protein [Burkholderia orbicola]|uniref:RHS repeat domain-containing protein n=1 Tax=Burkholderia orbicola TaxID=2978683 RepID=UPI002FE39ED2
MNSFDATAELFKHTPTLVVFDNRGRMVRLVQYNRTPGDGTELDERITRQSVNALGQVDSQIDPRLFSAGSGRPNFRYGSSLSGQILSSDGVDAGQRHQLMDIEGRPCWSLDSRGNQRRFSYDQLGRPRTVIVQKGASAERVSEYWQYGEGEAAAAPGCNLRGQVVAHYDTAGVLRMTAYSLHGRPLVATHQLLQSAEQDSDWALPETLWAKQLASPVYTTEWSYDALGVQRTQRDAKGNVHESLFNVAGQLSGRSLRYPGDSRSILLQEIDYTASGQKQCEKTGSDIVTAYQYEAQTQRLQRMTTRRSTGSPSLLQDVVYAYDPVGNVLSVADESKDVRYFANQEVISTNRYEYDALYQLVSATGRESVKMRDQGGQPPPWRPFPNDTSQWVNYRESYVYDRGGNLTDLHHRGAGNYHRRLTVESDSNRAELSHEGRTGVAGFDACGNLCRLTPDGQRLQWDDRNQLCEAVLVDRGGDESDREVYQYGGDGMRVRKMRRRLTSGVLWREEVIYLPGLEWRTRYAGDEARETLIVIVSDPVRILHWEKGKPDEIANNSVRYSLSNHLGSSTIELDGQGKLITAEEYYPYGGTSCWLSKGEVEAKYKTVRYSGKERDETGLYYYGYRYYAPWLQRWINPDPSGNVDGINLFAFTAANPLSYVDLLGDTIFNFKDGRLASDMRGEIVVNFDFPKELRLTDMAKFYLAKSKPGNSFSGVVDIETGDVDVYPLSIERRDRQIRHDWARPYEQEMHDDGVPIVHSERALSGEIRVAHMQLAEKINKPPSRLVGFTVNDLSGIRGRDGIDNRETSIIYGASRSLNSDKIRMLDREGGGLDSRMRKLSPALDLATVGRVESRPTRKTGLTNEESFQLNYANSFMFYQLPIEFKREIAALISDFHGVSAELRDALRCDLRTRSDMNVVTPPSTPVGSPRPMRGRRNAIVN